jgi:hypothetical protein
MLEAKTSRVIGVCPGVLSNKLFVFLLANLPLPQTDNEAICPSMVRGREPEL